MRFFLCSIFMIMISPIWPLGENPLPGDPYVIVNKRTNELAVILDNKVEGVYSVATGKTDDLTPEGEFSVTVKAANPYYRKKNIEGGSPDNPLGARWIGFDAKGTDGRIYGIHGTNREESIGKFVSNGCIRMHNDEVVHLFRTIPVGTRVLITDDSRSFEEIAIEHKALIKKQDVPNQ
ncbi:L,D-transpeptidase-like protein [Bacillus subtilis]|uniref:L,D-transpeptidase n=1 Tax=Bacillus inaquosorum TaxID=483913 RepID=UPI00105D36D1|nr:L,D-transpeptidase [Bacillus inaquosorum]TDO13448.1 L,D-transpeptidase-like protein [Bacillus subtilis]MCY7951599.1 L,D-transpeptidase [Bacillus inaquosorum]MEC0521172.1 L,D-transpeptidase [Bacillus inaquosorum]MEC0607848.1 L,D-transpeptidase [Bacillus inaquosorum]WIW28817.1 L,D-transpeptidase [Bacillus inaquosorum]